MSGRVTTRKDGAVGWITFDQPRRHNAMSLAMWQGLGEAATAFGADPEVRVVVLQGAGDKAFVSGADISEFEEKRSTGATIRDYDACAHAASTALLGLGKPTIAAIHGYCMGAGVAIALCCDLRIASDAARFAVPAAKLGLGYGFDGVRRLVEVVGPSFAKEIFYTARQFSAQEAQGMGLVNRVAPAQELADYVAGYAATIAGNAPLTVGSIKTLVGQVLLDASQRDEALCREVVERCFASADYIEGRRAFMEKRKPKFEGR